MSDDPKPHFQDFVEKATEDVREPELVRELLAGHIKELADDRRRVFEARVAYVSNMTGYDRDVLKIGSETGLQTFKWLFLRNAGAAGLMAAYIGSLLARSGGGATIPTHLFYCVAIFGGGCLSIAAAGGAAYFNYYYVSLAYPPIWATLSFCDLRQTKWPEPAGKRETESLRDFEVRNNADQDRTRRLSIFFAFLSGIFFAAGLIVAIIRI